MNEFEQINEIIKNLDLNDWPIEDQIKAGLIFIEFFNKLKPLIIKNEIINKETSTTYLFKL